MHWGHKLNVSRNEQKEVTREEYNDYVGVEYPAEPTVPLCAEHIWAWWWELDARRPPGFDSLAPITYTEIAAWRSLTLRAMDVIEVQWLIDMDNAWLHAIAEERRAKHERDKEEADRKQSGAKQRPAKRARRRK